MIHHKMYTHPSLFHDDVIKWKMLRVNGPYVKGIHGWIILTKASNTELCFLSAPEQTVEQTIETPVNWDVMASVMTSL